MSTLDQLSLEDQVTELKRMLTLCIRDLEFYKETAEEHPVPAHEDLATYDKIVDFSHD